MGGKGVGVVLRTYCPTYHGYTGIHSRLNAEEEGEGSSLLAPSDGDPHPHIGCGRRPLGPSVSLSEDRGNLGLEVEGYHVIYCR